MAHVLSERNVAPARPKWANTALFGMPGRRIFHDTPQHLTQGRLFFHPSSTPAPQAGQNSPCSSPSASRRDKNRPARTKRAKKGHFGRAGRVLYRKWPRAARAGRVLYRKWPRAARAGRILYRQRHGAVLGGECCPRLDTARVTSCRSPPTHAHRSQAVQSLRRSPHRHRWGFCTIRSPLAACHRRVVLLMVQFPPIGGGEAATHSGVVPTVQTTSAKSADNGLSWARWSTFWAQACLARRVVRTRTPEHAREPLETHVNPSTCTWAEPPTRITATGTLIWGSAAPSVAKLTAW